jgi:hypothetical protein
METKVHIPESTSCPCETGHSPPFCAKVWNAWTFTSVPDYTFTGSGLVADILVRSDESLGCNIRVRLLFTCLSEQVRQHDMMTKCKVLLVNAII